MPIDQKVDYVELPARDFDAVQTFYETAFDWSFTDYGPEYRAFSDGKIDGGRNRARRHPACQPATGRNLMPLNAG